MTVKKTTVLANELRLGNWVYYNDYPSNGFTRLNEHLMMCVFSDENWINHFISPIPLTEEILLKCGFEFSHFHGDERVFTNEYFILYVNTYDNNIVKFGGVNLKSLHQLQNLYFALTNQELKIEL